MRLGWIAVFFIFCLGLGNWVSMRSWHGTLYVYVGESRAPASVRSAQDYSAIDGSMLSRSAHDQLMAFARFYKNGDSVGIQLGHPLVEAPEGEGRAFACRAGGRAGAYDRMEMTFYGTGISENGYAPHLVVDAPCAASDQLDVLDTVWIPMADIIATPAKDQELQVPGESPEMIRLQHIPGQWPKTWVLSSVRFYNQDVSGQSLTIDASEMQQSSSGLLSFDWN